MFMYFTYCYGSFFFLSWLQTYLVKGRGFHLVFSPSPIENALAAAACAVFCAVVAVAKWRRPKP